MVAFAWWLHLQSDHFIHLIFRLKYRIDRICFLILILFDFRSVFLFISFFFCFSHEYITEATLILCYIHTYIYICTQSLSLTLIIATFEFNGYDFNKTAENSLSNLDISYSNIEVPFMTHILSPNCFRCHQFGLANHFISQANVPSKWAGRHIPTHTHSYTGRNNVYTFRLSTIVWDQH